MRYHHRGQSAGVGGGGHSQARAFAEAVKCSGGAFKVEWKGSVVVEQVIRVIDEVVLNVTDVGSNAGMDGGGNVRLLTVANASLHMSDMKVSNGSACSGGAIAAPGSILTFNRTAFASNIATYSGGALFVLDGSIVSWAGRRFSRITAPN